MLHYILNIRLKSNELGTSLVKNHVIQAGITTYSVLRSTDRLGKLFWCSLSLPLIALKWQHFSDIFQCMNIIFQLYNGFPNIFGFHLHFLSLHVAPEVLAVGWLRCHFQHLLPFSKSPLLVIWSLPNSLSFVPRYSHNIGKMPVT